MRVIANCRRATVDEQRSGDNLLPIRGAMAAASATGQKDTVLHTWRRSLGIISHMKPARTIHFQLPTPPAHATRIAQRCDPRLPEWMLLLRSSWRRPARVEASDFQDTQPSIRDTGPAR
jgi:hypothetical protein